MALFSGSHACKLHEIAVTDAFSSQFAALLAWSGHRPLMLPFPVAGCAAWQQETRRSAHPSLQVTLPAKQCVAGGSERICRRDQSFRGCRERDVSLPSETGPLCRPTGAQ